ncbi:MAG: orotidine-5'-phosphate decarboxylase [Elusimicrobiota bacterium]
MAAKTQIIVALDFDNLNEVLDTIKRLKGLVKYFKIGKELFTAYGPKSVEIVLKQEAKVFLDLKFHDIPNTVANACLSALKLGVSMINMHASGGKAMMQIAAEKVSETCTKNGIDRPLLLGVTVLTSLNDEILQKEVRISHTVSDQVVHLAKLCRSAGLDGIVCSPLEIEIVRKTCGDNFVLVAPGIRPAWSSKNDQKRITTPAEAVRLGADYIVIGRPVTTAENPIEAVKKILDEMENRSHAD